MKALIVDDNAAGRRILRYYLESHEARVTEACNGKEALLKAHSEIPDIIISDAQMPVMDGYQLLREVRKNPDLENTLFIFYSAVYTGEHDKDLALSLGADAFIVKPKDPNEFWNELKDSLALTKDLKRRACEKALMQEEKFLRKYSTVVAERLGAKVQDLRASEDLFRATFEQAPVGIAHVDLEGKWTNFNQRLCDILGYTREELERMNFQQITPAEELPEDLVAMQEFLAGQRQVFKREKHYIHKDGHAVWINLTATLRRDETCSPSQFICIIEEIGERKAMEERLHVALTAARKAEHRLSGVLRSLVDGLLICDGENRLIFANRAAEDMLGIRLSDACQHPVTEALNEEALGRALCEATTREAPSAVEMKIVHRKLGVLRDIQAITSVSRESDPAENSSITILRDITTERESDRLKSEFISTAAHELRTPLTSVMGYADLLLEMDQFNETLLRESLHIIAEKSQVLEKIIDELLDLSRVESGRTINLEAANCDLTQFLTRLLAQYETQIDERRFELQQGSAPLWVCADPRKLTQVLDNLVGNAVKFSEKGSLIRIHCESAGTEVRISVRDEGIGMSPEQRDRAFEKFYRADASNTARQGLGLGLAIVKNIVEAHGGHIGLTSEAGRGTEVFFSLPLGRCPEA